MDTSKVKSAIGVARSELKKLTDAEVTARSYNGLRSLGNAELSLQKAETRLDEAVKRVSPKEKKAKEKKATK